MKLLKLMNKIKTFRRLYVNHLKENQDYCFMNLYSFLVELQVIV